MAGEDISLDEKRVYGDTVEETRAFVASDVGVTRVEVAGDQIGRFSMVYDDPATSIAGADGRLVVGTESEVLIGTGDDFVETGFGPADVVGIADGTPLAVSPDGAVGRLQGDDWESIGTVTRPRRMDGDLLATRDGVVRVADGLVDLGGGTDVRDVAAAGPYAATGHGLLSYADGWTRIAGGDCTIVVADGDRAHAVSDDGLLVASGDDWLVRDLPADAAFADLGYGESLYAVTADGTFFVYADPDLAPDGRGGWRSRALGVRHVVGLAVP